MSFTRRLTLSFVTILLLSLGSVLEQAVHVNDNDPQGEQMVQTVELFFKHE